MRGVPSDLLPVGSPRQRLRPLQEVFAGSVLRSRLPRRTDQPPVYGNDDMGIDHDKTKSSRQYLDHNIDDHDNDDMEIDHDKKKL